MPAEPPSQRIRQVNALLLTEVGALLQREVEFPRDVLVTLKQVEASPDLHYATITVSVLPDGKAPSTLKRLEKVAPHLQRLLNGKLTMRYVPRIRFVLDRSEEKVTRIAELLQEGGEE